MRRFLVPAMVLALLVTACSSQPAQPGPAATKTKVVVALDWVPNTFHYWFFGALEQGYYDQAGLDVQFVVPDATTTSLKMVSLGHADVGISVGVDIIRARDAGLPLRVINTIWPSAPFGMIALADPVAEFKDIKGGTVGVLNTDIDHVCFQRMLAANGMSESDVTIVDPGFNLVPPLLSEQLVMVTGSDNFERVIAEVESGQDVTWYPYASVCPQTNMNLFVNDAFIEQSPDVIRAFNEASLRGLVWAMENPEAARDMFVGLYPEADPELELAMWTETIPTFCASFTAANGLGYSDAGQWKQLIDLMAAEGIIAQPYPVDEILTNDLLPEKPVVTQGCG